MNMLVPMLIRSTLFVERIGEKSLGIPSPGTTGIGEEIFIPLTRSGYIGIGSEYKTEKIRTPAIKIIKLRTIIKIHNNTLKYFP